MKRLYIDNLRISYSGTDLLIDFEQWNGNTKTYDVVGSFGMSKEFANEMRDDLALSPERKQTEVKE